jgi:hypothetical protein
MTTFERQERRGRARMSLGAVLKASLLAGLFVFILPAGGPWMSTESGIASMGRVLTLDPIAAGAFHAVIAFIYGAAIAMLIFHQRLGLSILLGVLLSLPLYAANFVIIRAASRMPANEMHVLLSHVVFCLLFSALYRAFSVPRVDELPKGTTV